MHDVQCYLSRQEETASSAVAHDIPALYKSWKRYLEQCFSITFLTKPLSTDSSIHEQPHLPE